MSRIKQIEETRDEQLLLDWNAIQRNWDRLQANAEFTQRKKWIDEARLPDAKAPDGETVSTDKLRRTLHTIHSHYGQNKNSWPSQITIAKEMDCSKSSVIRALHVLLDWSLLIKEQIKFERGVYNSYRIVWTEIVLREPSRRDAYLRQLFTGMAGVVTTEAGVVTTPKHFTNTSKNNSKNNSPLPASVDGDPWVVVVSRLRMLEMGKASEAVTAARSRELTVSQVDELIELWQRLRARQRNVTVGWLYRWLMGLSQPPTEQEPARTPSFSIASDTTRLELERAKIFAKLRKAGKSPTEIEDEIARKMQFGNHVEAALRAVN